MAEETNTSSLSIKLWAEDDRPREKLIQKGRLALSDAELISILISTGTKDDSALDLAKKILFLTDNNLYELGKLSIIDLKKIKGIGEAKAVSIIASLELGRRRKNSVSKSRTLIRSSKDIFDFFQPILSDLFNEEFWVLYLNRSNHILRYKRISEGGVSGTVVDLKIIFNGALQELASSIILCHNHPSGNIKPSEADIRLTQKIKQAGNIMEITLLDHLIIGENRYYSFTDEGII